jgi:hypothetical protein
MVEAMKAQLLAKEKKRLWLKENPGKNDEDYKNRQFS